jgi:hypothetical protein
MSGRQKRSTQLRNEREQVRQRNAIHLFTAPRQTPYMEQLERLLATPALDRDQAAFKADAIQRLAVEINGSVSNGVEKR